MKRTHFWEGAVTCALIAASAACTGTLGGQLAEDDGAQASQGGAATTGSGDFTPGNGGNGSGGFEQCDAVSQQATNQLRPVDIIWAIDTSPSMNGAINGVEQNVNAFADVILNQGIDVHVVLISESPQVCISPPLGSGNCPGASNAPSFQHVENWVGSHNALGRFVGEYPNYKATLRENSLKYFAVVTDDHPDFPGQQFIDMVSMLDPGWFDDWKMFGILCANKGGEYLNVINATGGVWSELCSGQPNYQQVFDALAQSVLESKALDCSWPIGEPPEGQVFASDLVNVEYTPGGSDDTQPIYHVDTAGDCGSQGGWYYDDNLSPQSIHVCPTTCDAIKADLEGKIDILFGCHTVEVAQ